jgi:hypothetical protein
VKKFSRWWVLLAVAGAGCVAGPSAGVDELVGFLRDGRTTRGEVRKRLGEPSGEFESGRLLTYRVGYDDSERCFRAVPREGDSSGWPDWKKADYSLVLLFEGGVLRRHELIKVK